MPETEIIPVKSDEHFSHLLKRPSPSCTPISDGNKEYGEKYFSKNYVGGMTDQKVNFEDYKENYKTSNLYFKQLNSPTPCLEETQSDQHNFYDSFVNENAILVDKNKQFKPELEDSTNLSDYTKELSSIECKSTNSLKLNIDDTKNSYQSSDIQNLNDSLKDKFETASMHLNFQTNSQCLNTSIFPYKENIPFLENESRSFSNTNFSAKNDLDDKIKPLQTELENHAQTINILVQQRNEAQNALVHAQNLLSKKSGMY